MIAVEQTGDESKARNLRGRPPFNWESFHVEIAMRIKSNSFPEKQEALIADMQKWCDRLGGALSCKRSSPTMTPWLTSQSALRDFLTCDAGYSDCKVYFLTLKSWRRNRRFS
jgi:hypothetical protein